MSFLTKIESKRSLFSASLLLAVFIIYPNIINFYWDVQHWQIADIMIEGCLMWIFRYLIFAALCWILLRINIHGMPDSTLSSRFLKNIAITVIAYAFYVMVSMLMCLHVDCFTSNLLFQFFVACLLCTTIGHVYSLNRERSQKEKEIEQLRIENLQSRCDALANQINPHFFFNSLNGLTALVRSDDKEKTLEYISKLSGVFRYILQSDKKGLVTLGEELDFVESYSYLHQIRYGDKLSFIVDVPVAKRNLRLPVVSLLPLIENVVKHNMVDSENPMTVTITLNANDELVITNPIQEKIDKPEKCGIGLSNLIKRFELLVDKDVRVDIQEHRFIVTLPLKSEPK